MKREEFHWALVTGASSGIGEALSRLLASKGINLIIHGRNEEKLNELAKELGGMVSVEVVIADMADAKQRLKVVDVIRSKAPELVINNAGFGLYGEALTYSTAEQMDILEVNGNALLQLTLDAARALISKGRRGVIMNIASAAAYPIFPCFAVYAASKAFAVRLSESLDEEMRSHGVRVLAACPGMVSTSFSTRAGNQDSQKRKRPGTMSVDFAAEEIWRQIESEKQTHIFNWLYRAAIFLVRYVMPKTWVAAAVRRDIDQRRPPRPLQKD